MDAKIGLAWTAGSFRRSNQFEPITRADDHPGWPRFAAGGESLGRS